MRLLMGAVFAGIVLLAGCGGSSEEDKVKQAFEAYVQAVTTKDGRKYCESVASPELAEAPRRDREDEIARCKDGFDDEDLSEAADQLGDVEIGNVTVKGDQAAADVTGTVNGTNENSPTRFLKVDGDWKVRFVSR